MKWLYKYYPPTTISPYQQLVLNCPSCYIRHYPEVAELEPK